MRPVWRALGAWSSALCLTLLASPGAAQDEPFDLDDEAEVAQPDAVEDEADADAAGDPDAADNAAEDAASSDASTSADELATWTMQLMAETGIGMREVELPRDGLLFQVSTGVFPALGLGFTIDHHPSKRFSIGLSARYQSSIGLVLTEQLTDGTKHPRNTRSHHFEIGLAPMLRLGDTGWAIYGALGYALSELDPENHLVTPSYHLGGPFARVGLQLPLGAQSVRLRLESDGQLVMQMGDELLALGAETRGLGVGASAALDVSLGGRWTVAATFRELRYWLGTRQGPSFTDSARFVTVQLRGLL